MSGHCIGCAQPIEVGYCPRCHGASATDGLALARKVAPWIGLAFVGALSTLGLLFCADAGGWALRHL